MNKRKTIRRILRFVLLLFIFLNAIAFIHAYSFTHFSSSKEERTSRSPTFSQKLKLLFTGINNPKPLNTKTPQRSFETVIIQSNKNLEGWLMNTPNARGTIILFHGYGGEKSSMLDKADAFLQMNLNVLLVDFMGAGGSEGNVTTIGFKEAQEVKDCFDFLKGKGYQNIVLFGTSMGAVAIMKAMNDYNLQPNAILLECPFGTMYKTVCARFKMFGVPEFPMAPLLVFWGGLQHGFWAFSHNPQEYAKNITCPTLLLWGEKDERVSKEETETIFQNLKGEKQLVTYPLAGHENYLLKYKDKWTSDVNAFLAKQVQSSSSRSVGQSVSSNQ